MMFKHILFCFLRMINAETLNIISHKGDVLFKARDIKPNFVLKKLNKVFPVFQHYECDMFHYYFGKLRQVLLFLLFV